MLLFSLGTDFLRQILLNDLDVSSSHMERLIRDLASSPAIIQNFLYSEVETVKESIQSMNNLIPRFRSILRVRRNRCLYDTYSSHPDII